MRSGGCRAIGGRRTRSSSASSPTRTRRTPASIRARPSPVRRTRNAPSRSIRSGSTLDCGIERFPNARFFVAADTVQARDVTRRRYGERILTHVTESPDVDPRLGDRYARLGQQAALADLIALSRTSIIIGTRFSSFSYVPAVWGGVPV